MACRRIKGLKWAKAAAKAPFPKPRATSGARAQGIRYERAVARELPDAMHGVWFEFEDANGRGFCQPDLLLKRAGTVAIIECKYTWIEDAEAQIDGLYRPVVEAALGLPSVGLVICKHLRSDTPLGVVFDSFNDAIGSAICWSPPPFPVVHWLGRTPLNDTRKQRGG